jgi:hypothetical protein
MKKTIALAAALLALGAGPAAAQDGIRHELALQLLEAMHIPEQVQASLATAIATQVRLNPDVPGLQAALGEFLGRYVTWAALRDDYAAIYAGAFDEEELREMTAFYRTPAGQRLARAQPQLTLATARLGERLVRQHAAELQEIIIRRIPATAPAPAP